MALSAAIAISLFLLEFGLVFGWRPGYTAIGVRAVRYAAGHWRQVARPGYRATTEHSLHLLVRVLVVRRHDRRLHPCLSGVQENQKRWTTMLGCVPYLRLRYFAFGQAFAHHLSCHRMW
jgi:hypothetical protein